MENLEKVQNDVFTSIVTSLSYVSMIKKSWVKSSAGSKEEYHYTKLNQLPLEEKIKFVWNFVLICGTYESTKVLGVQIKKQGNRFGYQGYNFELQFSSDEEKENYLQLNKFIHSANASAQMLDEVL